MPKIIDSFLFFQELDLLDIRLAYLDPYVDTFVIVEACQTFTGRPKAFCFEENIKRYSKYAHKIYYHKITDAHLDFKSIINYLGRKPSAAYSKLLNILQQHKHYPKSELRWVLDTYHRECIHLALEMVAAPEDIVILSDLDEIPCESIFIDGTPFALGEYPRVCRQHEFLYFLNFYKDSNWLGSIFSVYKNISNVSLNTLRIDSKVERKIVHTKEIYPGGYHFTSCGNIEEIVKKIKSWAHQELITNSVLKNLEHNIKTGQDIFEREPGTILTRVSLSDDRFYDKNLSGILARYPDRIFESEILEVKQSPFYGLLWKLRNLARKLMRKLTSSIKVAHSILIDLL